MTKSRLDSQPEDEIATPSQQADPTWSFRFMLDALPVAAYTCDALGRITHFNAVAASLWGRRPKLFDPADLYCGSHKLWFADLSPMAHEQCWMARALHEDRVFDACPVVIERPDGERCSALAHANPIHDADHTLRGGINVLIASDLPERANPLAKDERALLNSTIAELRERLQRANRMLDILLICAHCHEICDESGTWTAFTQHLDKLLGLRFTHGICPKCLHQHYGDIVDDPNDA